MKKTNKFRMAAMACVLSIIAMISGASVVCPPYGDDLIADPDNCYQYYQCSNGIPIPMTCPEDMCFNSDLRVCDYECLNCSGGDEDQWIGGYRTGTIKNPDGSERQCCVMSVPTDACNVTVVDCIQVPV